MVMCCCGCSSLLLVLLVCFLLFCDSDIFYYYRFGVEGFCVVATGSRAVLVVGEAEQQQEGAAGTTRGNDRVKVSKRRRIEQRTSSSTRLYNSNNNPLSSLMGNIMNNIKSSPDSNDNELLASRNLMSIIEGTDGSAGSGGVPTWEYLRKVWDETSMNDNERNFRDLVAKGITASPLNQIRIFNNDDENDIRVVLYRDHASWCPYCQKVWLSLEEKRISYRVKKINMSCYGDKPTSFYTIQPNGQIPVAIIDGVTYRQSNDILSILEGPTFSQYKSLLPPVNQRNKMKQLLQLERQIFSTWLYWLTGGGEGNKRSFIQTLDMVESELSSSTGPFFMGNDVTTVDFMYIPFLERMCASLLYFKGFQIRYSANASNYNNNNNNNNKLLYPSINRWFNAMETLPSYQLTKSDYYTHCWDLPPQLGGCIEESEGKYARKIINGEDSSLELGRQEELNQLEPEWTWLYKDSNHELASKREVVERLTWNHDAIISFALRGASKQRDGGFFGRGYGAPLADPNAIPSNDPNIRLIVDAILRLITNKLLNGDSCNNIIDEELIIQKIIDTTSTATTATTAAINSNDIIDCLLYLRNRIGVPRDMRLPAARQLRAHLNWAINIIIFSQEK